jgi:hypothetical protein
VEWFGAGMQLSVTFLLCPGVAAKTRHQFELQKSNAERVELTTHFQVKQPNHSRTQLPL